MDMEQVQNLIAELQTGDDRQRRAASYRLSKSKDVAAARALMSAINDTDSAVRSNAIAGLRSMDSAEAREFLAAHRVEFPEPEESAEPAVPTASMARRLFNLLIDQTVFQIAAMFIIDPFIGTLFGARVLENIGTALLLNYAELAVFYFLFEWALQKTPGKFFTDTRVIMLDGSKPDARAIARRTLARFVPFEPISMYTGKDPEQNGTWWHDRWTGTRVVRG